MTLVGGHEVDVRLKNPGQHGYSSDEREVFDARSSVIYFLPNVAVSVDCMMCGARGRLCTGVQSCVVTVDGEQATDGVNMAFLSVPASEVYGARCLKYPHEVQDFDQFMSAVANQWGLVGDEIIDGESWDAEGGVVGWVEG